MDDTRNTTFWKSRPVFVTGGTGLLGGWLVESLLSKGAEVVALVRDEVPRCMLLRNRMRERVTIVHGDLSDHSLLRRALAEYSIDTVFHLAAQSQVGAAKRDPLSTLEANVAGTWNILEACRVAHTERVLIASSDKAYGVQPLPYHEDQPLAAEYPYDVSKSCADLVSRMYYTSFQLPVVIVRCANLFGGGDLNFDRLIPGVIKATLEGKRFVIRSDGKFLRDYLYVQDAADAYLQAAERLQDGKLAGEAFNFSMEIKPTVLEVVSEVLRLLGREDLQPTIQNGASNEIREQYLSVEKAHRVLGWYPQHLLAEALSKTIEWYREFFASAALAEAERDLQVA